LKNNYTLYVLKLVPLLIGTLEKKPINKDLII